MISWQAKQFKELTTNELFELLKLRVDVFVVEQNCAYPELDEKDRHAESRHLMGFKGDTLVACARLLAPGVSYPSASIGRVATKEDHRGSGMGKLLMAEAISHCESIWPTHAIEIGAQEYLKRFYEGFGFVSKSQMYLEDGIPHIDMKRAV
ncbi:GNAT family N-acetyltransferase [Alteromonas sp. MTD1]|uniref:GNAT family N-acetyltransferase n=1 Tax=Alteromonas sp. MTD1 TaxID=3057962 RepID=UPI0036F44C1F